MKNVNLSLRQFLDPGSWYLDKTYDNVSVLAPDTRKQGKVYIVLANIHVP